MKILVSVFLFLSYGEASDIILLMSTLAIAIGFLENTGISRIAGPFLLHHTQEKTFLIREKTVSFFNF